MFNVDLTKVKHHPALTAIVDVLRNVTQNDDRSFYNVEVAYFLGKIASCMRAVVVTKDRGEIPVNIYALALATSGFGKGHSVAIMEEAILAAFRQRFVSETMATVAKDKIETEADLRALRANTDPTEEFNTLWSEYSATGAYPFTFDSGTPPAVKQLRHKLLLACAGSINLQIDEIGLNLLGSVDLMTLFLELYDQGQVKQKLTKNTSENKRADEIYGKTPTNMLLFGTPSELFDGSQTESQFDSFLETGYARRCFFGYGNMTRTESTETAEERYKKLIAPENNKAITYWSDKFAHLADESFMDWKMELEDPEGILLLAYKMHCEKEASLLPEHEGVRKAELSHRYFKALKLAGAYAFIDQSPTVTRTHLLSAIKLAEETGSEFYKYILDREKTYEKLAKFITEAGKPVTHPDLHNALAFYRAGGAQRTELMNMAIAWGYQNHRIIKKQFRDGIEFFSGETLKQTDINNIMISASPKMAEDYEYANLPFSDLVMLGQQSGINWANHAFANQYRDKKHVIPGFNMLVLDIDNEDESTSLEMVQNILSEYTYITYTTKSHQRDENGDRFRLLMPINYVLQLDDDDYKEFMGSICNWLPFSVDTSANQRERKWLTNEGIVNYNEGTQLLDVLDFIPRTSRNETRQSKLEKLHSLDSMERWFMNQMGPGNRNNNMVKFALALVDSNMLYTEVKERVLHFNSQLQFPLDQRELEETVLKTAAKRSLERQRENDDD